MRRHLVCWSKKNSINRRNLEEKYLRVSKMRNATTMRRRKNVTKMSLRLLSRLMYLCYCYIDTVFESRSFKTAAPMSRTHYMLTADCLEMILLVEWQEAHPACRNIASLCRLIPMGLINPKQSPWVLLSETLGEQA